MSGLCPRCLMAAGLDDTSTGGASEPDPGGADEGLPPAAVLERLFPQLEIVRLLGRGGMGAVYLVRQRALDRLVALKVLLPSVAAQPGFAERFQREARALAGLSHPHIVTVHDFGQVDDVYYFIMEYVDGPSLRQLMRGGRLAPREALALVPALCDALQYAHDDGVVHRDIKPENILLDRRGRLKVADFGLAKLLGRAAPERLTGTRQTLGTPHYMAPEQLERPTQVDHRADIYSLGVVLYEMLTGELPLGRFEPPSRKVEVDVRLDEVVLRSLEKAPERRYQQAWQVKTQIESLGSEAPPLAAPAATSPAGSWLLSPTTDNLLRVIVLILVLAVSCALAVPAALLLPLSLSTLQLTPSRWQIRYPLAGVGLLLLVAIIDRGWRLIRAEARPQQVRLRRHLQVALFVLCLECASLMMASRHDQALAGALLFIAAAVGIAIWALREVPWARLRARLLRPRR